MNIRIIISLFLTLTMGHLDAQSIKNYPKSLDNLDQDFINSLPEDMRSQLMEEMGNRNAQENEKNLKPPSTEIMKPKDEDIDSDKFGINFFRSMQTSFMPINEPVFDPSYIVGYGDEILIQFVGQKNEMVKQLISRDGSINLPEIGKLAISGLTLSRVDELIKSKIKQSFIGVEAFTTLSSIKDMQILVVGEAAFPGVYTLPGNASLLNVISAAGGFNEFSSLRNIEIRREGKIQSTVDLYQAFIYGDFSKVNKPLRPGDTIFIRPSDFEVRIQGGVRREGIFELLDGEGFAQLLDFANGYKKTAKISELQLTRVSNEEVNYSVYDDTALKNIKLQHEDIITIQSIETLSINIQGAVERPGTYIMPEGSTMLDLINISGGYKEQSYPFGGIYMTKSAKDMELETTQRLRKDLINFIATTPVKDSSQNYDPKLLLEEFLIIEPKGRVSMDFSMSSLRANSGNFLLQNDDVVIIPNFENIVHVYGDVENNGSFVFRTGKTIEDYINAAGGKKGTASDKVILYHPNGESELVANRRFFSLESNNQFIFPGTLIYVPREFELSVVETTNLYLPVISNLAVTLASIASLSNNTK